MGDEDARTVAAMLVRNGRTMWSAAGRGRATTTAGAEPVSDTERITFPRLAFSTHFTWSAVAIVGLAAAGVAAAIGWVAYSMITDLPDTAPLHAERLAAVVALILVGVGVVVAAVGLVSALLERRGRAAEEDATPLVVADTHAADVLEQFGKLRATSAVLALAGLLFAGAAAIGWQLVSVQAPADAASATDDAPGQEG